MELCDIGVRRYSQWFNQGSRSNRISMTLDRNRALVLEFSNEAEMLKIYQSPNKISERIINRLCMNQP